MSACEAMIAAAVASTTSGNSAQAGASRKNGCSTAAGLLQQQRALSEVVQQQRRQHQGEPRQADGPLAEMSHVGVQRLAAGDDEEDRAEHGEAVPAVLAEEANACRGSIAGSTTGMLHDPAEAEDRQHQEPHDHDRSEQPADAIGAVPLDREDADRG